MNEETSVYLDFVRFSAAAVVMFSHLGGRSWTAGLGWQFVPFGTPAVDVFFVLSGFVIAHVVATKEKDFRTYAISRAARLYSVCIPAIFITAIICFLGARFNPAVWWGDHSSFQYIAGLLFVNQIWFASIEPGNNGPYWSLGYEAFYYLIFAAYVFSPTRFKLILTFAALLAAGPRIAVMMPIWLMGVGAYHSTRKLTLTKGFALTLWCGSVITLAALAAFQLRAETSLGFMTASFARSRHQWPQYGLDYVIGALVSANFVGFYFSSSFWTILMKTVSKTVAWLAGATFTLYLLHFPVAQFLIAASPWKIGAWQQRTIVYVGTIFVVFAVAQVTERRKRDWRVMVSTIIPAPRKTLAVPGDG